MHRPAATLTIALSIILAPQAHARLTGSSAASDAAAYKASAAGLPITINGQPATPDLAGALLKFGMTAQVVEPEGRGSTRSPLSAARDALFRQMTAAGTPPTVYRSAASDVPSRLKLMLNHGATKVVGIDLSPGAIRGGRREPLLMTVTLAQQGLQSSLVVPLGPKAHSELNHMVRATRPAPRASNGNAILPTTTVPVTRGGGPARRSGRPAFRNGSR